MDISLGEINTSTNQYKGMDIPVGEINTTTNPKYIGFSPGTTTATSTDRIVKTLNKHGITAIFNPTTKIQQCLSSAEGERDPLSEAEVVMDKST